jgi:hypothetical protein
MSYWSQFLYFDHDPNAPIKEEFKRLAELEGWLGKAEHKKERYRKE